MGDSLAVGTYIQKDVPPPLLEAPQVDSSIEFRNTSGTP